MKWLEMAPQFTEKDLKELSSRVIPGDKNKGTSTTFVVDVDSLNLWLRTFVKKSHKIAGIK